MNTPDREIGAEARKNHALFLRQKELLDTFLANGAVTRAQYDKSLSCLIEKMGIEDINMEQQQRPKRGILP